jgi:hypothetical protein
VFKVELGGKLSKAQPVFRVSSMRDSKLSLSRRISLAQSAHHVAGATALDAP